MRYYQFIIVILFLVNCKPSAIPTSTVAINEDLSIHRPEIPEKVIRVEKRDSVKLEPEIILKGHLGEELDSVNALITERNKERKYWDGFTIQVYTGSSRVDAYNARDQLMEITNDFEPVLNYRQPNYKVKIGQFNDRLEAHRFYMEIKSNFPRALMLPEKIQLLLDE